MSEAPPITGRIEYIDPEQLDDHPGNWKFHPQEQLDVIEHSVSKFGHLQPMGTFNERTGRLLNGHARKTLYAGKGPVPIWVVDLDQELESEALALLDSSGWCSTPDKAKFADLLKNIKMPTGAAGKLLENVRRSSQLLNKEAQEDIQGDPTRIKIPYNTIWPSTHCNVPDLIASQHAKFVVDPVSQWGSVKRNHFTPTFHMYVHDFKLEVLWKNPDKIEGYGCKAIVEANFSATDRTPWPRVIWDVFRKRWLSRYWQALGYDVFVDLNVDREWHRPTPLADGLPPNLLGVPRGWPSYASRCHGDPDAFLDEYEVAREWSGTENPLFLVFGGGNRAKALAGERGWIWQPEPVQQRLGREEDAA